MSNINWTNVSAPNVSDAARLMQSGGEQISNAFSGLGGILKNRAAGLTKKATDEAAAGLYAARDGDALAAEFARVQQAGGQADMGQLSKLYADRSTGLLNEQSLQLGNTEQANKNKVFFPTHEAEIANTKSGTAYNNARTAGSEATTAGQVIDNRFAPKLKQLQVDTGENNLAQGKEDLWTKATKNQYLPKELETRQTRDIADAERAVIDARFAPSLHNNTLLNGSSTRSSQAVQRSATQANTALQAQKFAADRADARRKMLQGAKQEGADKAKLQAMNKAYANLGKAFASGKKDEVLTATSAFFDTGGKATDANSLRASLARENFSGGEGSFKVGNALTKAISKAPDDTAVAVESMLTDLDVRGGVMDGGEGLGPIKLNSKGQRMYHNYLAEKIQSKAGFLGFTNDIEPDMMKTFESEFMATIKPNVHKFSSELTKDDME